MIAFLDHDDFIKSRKALLVSSILLLTLQNLSVTGDSIKLLGIEVEYDQELFIIFLKVTTLYLLYVFVLHAIGILSIQMKERREKRLEERANEILKDFEEREVSTAFRIHGGPTEEDRARIDQKLKAELANATRLYDRLIDLTNLLILLIVKIFVPAVVSGLALFGYQVEGTLAFL